MKKTILLSSILAAGAVFAEAKVDSTEIGVMGIKMPTRAALIAVPFLGYDTTDIKVADMVNTAELAAGSELYVPNASGKYDVWSLDASKQWIEMEENVVIGADGAVGTGVTPNAADVLTPRGGAFWLKPAGTPTGNCYLLGQPTDATGTSVAKAGKWNLIGNTSDQDVKLPSGGFVRGDMVSVPQENGNLLTYNWKSDKNWWLRQGAEIKDNQEITIQPGQGIWFFAKGFDRTITWK